MRVIFIRNRSPMLWRAIKASLVALVLVGGGCTWQKIANERIAERAEQARIASLKMPPRKLEALKREAEIAAAARAYAEQYEANRRMQARRAGEDLAHPEHPPSVPRHKG